MDCGFDGDAWAELFNDEIVWMRTDQRIHVTEQLLAVPSARTEIEKKYDLGPWCTAGRAFHAILKESE